MPSIKTQGTELYFVDALTSSVEAIVKLTCPTGVTGLGGAADQIDDTCLDALVDKSFTKGLGNPGQVTVPFVLKADDVGAIDDSHKLLFDLKDDGSTINWLLGLSDGTAQPAAIDSNDEITPPAGRSFLSFDAYVADLNIDIATNEVVRGTLLLQRSGVVTPSWKA